MSVGCEAVLLYGYVVTHTDLLKVAKSQGFDNIYDYFEHLRDIANDDNIDYYWDNSIQDHIRFVPETGYCPPEFYYLGIDIEVDGKNVFNLVEGLYSQLDGPSVEQALKKRLEFFMGPLDEKNIPPLEFQHFVRLY